MTADARHDRGRGSGVGGHHPGHRLLGAARDGSPARDARQVGVHLLGRGVAVVRVLRERAHHDRVEVVGDLGPELRRGIRHDREVLHRDLHRRVAGERHLPGEHLVEDDPERVQVGTLVDRLPACLLRREVLRRPDDRARLGHLGGAAPRDPEVGHLHVPVRADDHVVRLDVAVDDLVPVRFGERAQDLPRELDRRQRRSGPLADEQLLERRPVEVLHRDVVGAVDLAAVVDPDDVRMVQPGGVPRLPFESLDELVVARVALVQDLQRDLPPELLVLGQVHVGHPARAEPALDAVAPVEEGADQTVFGVRGHGYPFIRSTRSEGGPASAASQSEPRPRRRSRCPDARRRPRRRPSGGRRARRR